MSTVFSILSNSIRYLMHSFVIRLRKRNLQGIAKNETIRSETNDQRDYVQFGLIFSQNSLHAIRTDKETVIVAIIK